MKSVGSPSEGASRPRFIYVLGPVVPLCSDACTRFTAFGNKVPFTWLGRELPSSRKKGLLFITEAKVVTTWGVIPVYSSFCVLFCFVLLKFSDRCQPQHGALRPSVWCQYLHCAGPADPAYSHRGGCQRPRLRNYHPGKSCVSTRKVFQS